jgi:hypothetical protein
LFSSLYCSLRNRLVAFFAAMAHEANDPAGPDSKSQDNSHVGVEIRQRVPPKGVGVKQKRQHSEASEQAAPNGIASHGRQKRGSEVQQRQDAGNKRQ